MGGWVDGWMDGQMDRQNTGYCIICTKLIKLKP